MPLTSRKNPPRESGVRFCDVTEAFARKEGEGDLSLEYWKKEHQRFFSSEGHFSEDMELIAEEFEVVKVL